MENKIAFLLPGQGSQKLNMGSDLLDSPVFLKLKEENYDVEKIIKDKELLNENAAYIIYAVSKTLFDKTIEMGLIPDVILGFSLGEIVGLGCAKYLEEEETYNLIKIRTRAMDKNCSENNSSMLSINGITLDEVKKHIEGEKDIYIANINSPKQIVLSGDKNRLTLLNKKISELKIAKCIALNVKGAFHSPYMESVGKVLKDYFKNTKLKKPEYNLMSNYLGDYHSYNLDKVKESIIKQVYSPVEFLKMVTNAYEDGVRTFIEIGEGKTLTNLVSRSLHSDKIRLFNINNIESLKKNIEVLKNKY